MISNQMAIKTFANKVLLYNDVPTEIVSTLLGHSKLQTIQDLMVKRCRGRLV